MVFVSVTLLLNGVRALHLLRSSVQWRNRASPKANTTVEVTGGAIGTRKVSLIGLVHGALVQWPPRPYLLVDQDLASGAQRALRTQVLRDRRVETRESRS
jgi:hypothetical protein